MTKKELAHYCLACLQKTYGPVFCGLDFQGDTWHLLIMGILSAQCKDERVNAVSKDLFRLLPDAGSCAEVSETEIAQRIKSLGLFRSKAAHIKRTATVLIEKFQGKVPDNMEDLLTLPGVGRKVANLVLSDGFKQPGMVVDTHNLRLSYRLGLTDHKDPVTVEKDLCALLEPEHWSDYGHYMVTHGRAVCHARKPECSRCVLASVCAKRL